MLHNTIKQMPKFHRLTIVGVGILLLLILLWPVDSVDASKAAPAIELEIGKLYPVDIELSSYQSDETFQPTETIEATSYTVKSGDTLAQIFSSFSLSPQTTHKVSHSGDAAKQLRKIKPGDTLHLLIDAVGSLKQLSYQLSKTDTLIVALQDEKYVSSIKTEQIDKVLNFAQGSISSNFWNAGAAAGLTDKQIMELAGIFGWDIDFAQEIRRGDSFNLVFESLYIDGEYIGRGDIVSAEFVNQGSKFTAIRYDDGFYYTPEGRSMRKSFLRAPVNFRYVSSNFNPQRLHPVLKRIRPHRGVDYVAKVGTPIMAAGNGKVIEASYNRFNGHYVFIKHGERYQTKYLHLNKRAVKKGQSVKQGQVIGYLGGTGMVTGAHLHYEFLVDGVHRNPRTVDLPKAEPIDKSQLDKFLQIANNQLDLLSKHKRIMLASN